MSRPVGPGPGAYMLPTSVGFNKHDVRKQRMPMYSLKDRTNLESKGLGPGPGAYQVNSLTRYGVSRGNQFVMGQRTFMKESSIGPGPAAHEVHKKPFFKGSEAPKYTMRERNTISYKQHVPGPNAYMVNVKTIKPRAPSYNIGERTELKKKVGSPGPAAYGPSKPSLTLPNSPQFTMTSRKFLQQKGLGPGANNYNLMYYRPGKKAPAFYMGKLHSPYKLPMIVKCDNI